MPYTPPTIPKKPERNDLGNSRHKRRLDNSNKRLGAGMSGRRYGKAQIRWDKKKKRYVVYNYWSHDMGKGAKPAEIRSAYSGEIKDYEDYLKSKGIKLPSAGSETGEPGTGQGNVDAAGRVTGSSSSSSSGSSSSDDVKTSSPFVGYKPDDKKTIDRFFHDMLAPARRSLARERRRFDERKAASEGAWGSYNTWLESQRTKYNQQAAAIAAENKTRADDLHGQTTSMVSKFADQGFVDASLQSGATAAAADAVAGQSATSNATQSALDAINQDYANAQLNIDSMASAEARSGLDAAYMKGIDELAAKEAELNEKIAAAKLDRFYKDRQYGLDKEAAEWLRSSQGRALDQKDEEITADKERTKAERAAAAAAKAKEEAQERADALDDILERDKDLEERMNKSVTELEELKTSLGWTDEDAGKQGEIMRVAARQLRLVYHALLGNEEAAKRIMVRVFGERFRGQPRAMKEFSDIWNGRAD